MHIIKVDVQLPVTVRKFVVDIKALQRHLIDGKKAADLTNKQIAEKLDLPLTHVEHYFRTDKCFSIPSADVWGRLKEMLGITTTVFDESVTEFEERPGVYDQAQRLYSVDGIAPTLTAAGAVSILEPITKQEYKGAYKTMEQLNGLTLNDFFCGCGGMGLGFNQAGFETVGAWDFDRFAVQTYKANVDERVEQADITQMKWTDIPKASVWAFGFPCQDLSVAGAMGGMKVICNTCGEEFVKTFEVAHCPNCGGTSVKAANRSGLFYEVMRLLEELKENDADKLPQIIMAENVKGLKPFIPALVDEYKKHGYTAHITLFNSKYWDVPQNRERYFIVGTRDDLDLKFEFPVEQHTFVPKLSTILEPTVAENFYIAFDKAQEIIKQALKKLAKLGSVHATITPDRVEKRQNGRRAKEDEEEMFTLTAQDLHGVIVDEPKVEVLGSTSPTGHGGENVYSVDGIMTTIMARDSQGAKRILEPKIEVVGNMSNTGHCGENVYATEGISPTVKARDYKDPIRIVEPQPTLNMVGKLEGMDKCHDIAKRVYDVEGIAPTLTYGGGNTHAKILEPQTQDCQKLAGMFDEEGKLHQAGSVWNKNGVSPTLDTAQGGYRQPLVVEDYNAYRVRKLTPTEYGRLQGFPMETWTQVVSNSQAYKQFGNAVTVNVAKAIAMKIAECIKG